MPIITLDGTKGGTGRTTAAAMLTLGLLSHGASVALVETATDTEPLPLKRWCRDVAVVSTRGNQLSYAPYTSAAALTSLAKSIETDESRFVIIDTGRHDTKIRAVAFAIADLIIMPFTSDLDAKCGIEDAAKYLPMEKDVIGLATQADRDLSARVLASMPLLDTALPNTPEFSLFSEAAKVLIVKTLSKARNPYAGSNDTSTLLFELATEVRGRTLANMHDLINRPSPAVFSPGHQFQRPELLT